MTRADSEALDTSNRRDRMGTMKTGRRPDEGAVGTSVTMHEAEAR